MVLSIHEAIYLGKLWTPKVGIPKDNLCAKCRPIFFKFGMFMQHMEWVMQTLIWLLRKMLVAKETFFFKYLWNQK